MAVEMNREEWRKWTGRRGGEVDREEFLRSEQGRVLEKWTGKKRGRQGG